MTTQGNNSFLRKWLFRMLKPILRICLRHSLKLGEVVEIAKETLVAAAQEELVRSGEQVSASRISVMTGVHRKDVSRITGAQTNQAQPKQKNEIARVMSRWQTDSAFRTKAGKPRVLTVEGRGSEFAQLADAITGGNVSPYTILSEMERLGIVERTRGKVRLMWRDFAPKAELSEGLQMLAEDTQDLIEAVHHNIVAEDEIPHLHLKTEFTEIPTERLSTVKAWILEEGSRFHRKVREYLSEQDSPESMPNTFQTARVAYGSYSFVEENVSDA